MAEPFSPPTRERLLALVDAMAGQPVLMLVDLVADRFIAGTPKRISREAPVLILRYEGETLAPGGGANAVANVRALGGVPLPIGLVGDDESGTRLLAELAARDIATDGVVVRRDYRTPTKTRILAGFPNASKQQIVRFDVEEPRELTTDERVQLTAALAHAAGRARVAVVSDYGYGCVVPELLPDLRRSLAAPGTVLCDSRFRLADFAGVDAATPNEEEAEALLGAPLGEAGEALRADGARLLARLAARFLLVTRGSRGMALFLPAGTAQVPVHGTDQVADVTGAGDTVIGTFALALAADATPVEAALLANYAGGVVVMKMGTATLSRAELAAALLADDAPRARLRWDASSSSAS